MKHIVLVVLFLTSLASQRAESCKSGWSRYLDKCYKFFTISKSFFGAQLSCAFNEDSRLASITDSGILQFLTQQEAYTSYVYYWVGLRRINGSLYWNSNMSADDQPWVTSDQTQSGDLCFRFDGAKVEPHLCTLPLGYICEASYVDHVNSHCQPDSYASEASGRCIYRTLTPVVRDEADVGCEEDGGEFMDINDIIMEGVGNLYQHKIFDNDGKRYWTKMRWNGTNILWQVGNSQMVMPTEAVSWFSGSGECVTAVFNRSNVLETHLHQTDCSEAAYVVCITSETTTATASSTAVTTPRAPQDADLKCPTGFNWKEDRSTGFCYWETSYETNRLSWQEARNYCQSYGGDLASFHSIDEEKLGLSFQYGSISHPYWIGLKLDLDTGEYVWSDGSPVDYQNWGPGQPNHKDRRLRCASMDASATHWVSSLCGVLSWFVCKAPRQRNPKIAVIPTRAPLLPCSSESESSYYFEGYCYQSVAGQRSWHRAEQYCENEGGTLVSIHNDREIGFLLRLLYEDRNLLGNRVWIGLNSLGFHGSFKWVDHSPLYFTHWNENEPNNLHNQEKCCNMYIGNGLWNDENCNAVMGFVCKTPNDSSAVPSVRSTAQPRTGNCKKGWFAFQNRCYLPVGDVENQRANWSIANSICHDHGGYLTSVHNEMEQTFLTLLVQRLKGDTWIGLHDTVQSELYYWTDNSDVSYTNWAPGEPSFLGYEEDCVSMVYDSLDSGSWKDERCSRKLSFICQNERDPNLEPAYNRGMSCLHPENWLQLDNSCYALFPGNPQTWTEAEAACQKHGAHLVSVTDTTVQAAVRYLAAEGNFSVWIGLQRSNGNEISWINGAPAKLSRWENNEPGDLSLDNLCFASSAEGFWSRIPCSEKRPFICQVTSGRPAPIKRYSGDCPSKTDLWINEKGSYCYIFDADHKEEWHSANFRCFMYGGSLISIHSMEQLEKVKALLGHNVQSFYIGLTRNDRGGFAWSDDTPVDFVNWDLVEPRDNGDQCVMVNADLKWRVTPCSLSRHFICSGLKDKIIEEYSPESARYIDDPGSSLSAAALTGILVILILVVVTTVSVVIYYRPLLQRRFRLVKSEQSMSFENALYNADSASMEFEIEKNHSFVN